MSDVIVVLVTAKTREEAEKIGRTLVTEGLAACVNLVTPVSSIFSWEGKIEQEEEALLIIKSLSSLFGKLEARVKEIHSYQVPEIIALPVTAGSNRYLEWVKSVCQEK